jgi:hypothetical protein
VDARERREHDDPIKSHPALANSVQIFAAIEPFRKILISDMMASSLAA